MSKLPDLKDTIVALATALGSGSIAIIRLSGLRAIEITDSVFDKNISNKDANTIHFGRIMAKNKEYDQVVVSIFKTPNSYTGENVVEISCHANNFIVGDIIDLLIKNGARPATAGEFTMRAFLNGKMDLSQAESVASLINSKSKKGIKNSLLHLEGKLSDRIINIKNDIVDVVSSFELQIDFSQEDLDVADPEEIKNKLLVIQNEIEYLIKTFNYAKLLEGNIDISIAGKPNVGKSSLLNCLLGENRAIVSHIPGTTRDTVRESILLHNILIKITDTAGLRKTEDEIEEEGVLRTKNHIQTTDLIIFMFDISKELDKDDLEIVEQIEMNYMYKSLITGNKKDIGINHRTLHTLEKKGIKPVMISAKFSQGIEEIKNGIVKYIMENIDLLEDEIIITSTRQKILLQKSVKYVNNAIKTLKENQGIEFVVVDLRNALNYLGEIIGETATDDILHNIFSKFCIGK